METTDTYPSSLLTFFSQQHVFYQVVGLLGLGTRQLCINTKEKIHIQAAAALSHKKLFIPIIYLN